MDGAFWPGLIAMAVLYVAVFGVGVLASRGRRQGGLAELMLAGRSLPLWVGFLTMTATWVGGGYINGTAEQSYAAGVFWGAQAGLGYALALVIGGLLFARVIRRHAFRTLVDPLEARYGRFSAALLMVPAVLAELFWSAAILVALGTTFGTVMGMDLQLAILLSAAVAIAYTVVGGLRAVAYTDVIQLALILLGLSLALPFILHAAGGWSAVWGEGTRQLAQGLSGTRERVSYGDWMILLMLGGIPWNVYFQRVLSARDEATASRLSIGAGVLCALMALPPLVLGLAATQLDWASLASGAAGAALGGPVQVMADLEATPALVLPYALRLAVPEWVAIIGLGAIAAAVMSSVDSSILSASSLLSWNGYRRLVRPQATAHEMAVLMRGLVVVLGAAAVTIALSVQSVSALWYLCGDVVYCVLFPQLALALFDRRANIPGALAGLGVSVFLRLGGGEPTLGLPAFLPYPEWGAFEFPFRTVAMLAGLITALAVSRLTAAYSPARPLSVGDVPDEPIDHEEESRRVAR